VLILSFAFYCATRETRQTQSGETVNSGQWGTTQGMVMFMASSGPFYIDQFESAALTEDILLGIPGAPPAAGLTQKQARAYCQRAGKRLCSGAEWRAACLGAARARFSYGNAYEKGRCNTASSSDRPTGSLETCRNVDEMYDMVGNVMEWVENIEGERSIALGGAYSTGPETDCFTRQFFPPETASRVIGFRCCKSGGSG